MQNSKSKKPGMTPPMPDFTFDISFLIFNF